MLSKLPFKWQQSDWLATELFIVSKKGMNLLLLLFSQQIN